MSVKGVLSELNASTSGYYDWKKRKPSKQTKRQERIREQIVKIHEESYTIYGAPKITEVLRSKGHRIAQRTVSKYMNEEGIKANYIKPYTTTTPTVTLQAS
ncbi:IS3 family transposase [Erysipelothrix rhusiopathiae]|uniref:IS3 family transposase n=1 Tax=Erysipelothrix rhusiopathiae TaxID=1648 RepID=UPI0037C05BB0